MRKGAVAVKIKDILAKGEPTLSFEVFPPKTDTAFDSVKTATEEIAKLRPSFMSVTYGAGGGTSKYTLDIAKNIKELYNIYRYFPDYWERLKKLQAQLARPMKKYACKQYGQYGNLFDLEKVFRAEEENPTGFYKRYLNK